MNLLHVSKPYVTSMMNLNPNLGVEILILGIETL